MNNSTKKWIFLKFSSAILIPLMLWFVINLTSIIDKSYIDVISFFSALSSKILFSLFIIFSFSFFALTISEVFEDYIQDEKIKNVASKLLYFFAMLIPLATIINLFNLSK